MKVLVVGLGSMGKRRIRNLLHLDAGEIVAFDFNPDRREEAAKEFNISVVDSFDAGLAAEPEAVVISTPPTHHLEYALKAVKASKHIFTEADVTHDGVASVIEAARINGVVAAPSCTMRFHPSVKKMKSLLDEGRIGRLLTFTHHCGQYLPDWHPWEDYRKFYVSRKETGACREIVPFELTWLTSLVGPVTQVSAMRDRMSDLEFDIDDVFHLLLRTKGDQTYNTDHRGAIGHLLVDVVSRAALRATRFLGTEGTIEWDASSKNVRLYDAESKEWTDFPEPEAVVVDGYSQLSLENMYIEEMAAFMQACLGNAPYPHDFESDSNILKVLDAAEDSTVQRRILSTSRGALGHNASKFDGARTHALIPGGAHTYSKGDDQFPENAPLYLESGEGVTVTSQTGEKFLDWGMGLRSVTLGYGVTEVNEAAIDQIWRGSNFTKPSWIETEAAQDIVDLIPGAEMVKFAKNGSTITTAAVKLARAYTGRDLVAFCSDHPFYSYDDWFIGKTTMNHGVPKGISDLSLTFRYNDFTSVERLFSENPGQISCVIMEAATFEEPVDGFLQKIQDLCRKEGALFILDEMITGFRIHNQGAQAYYGVDPDMSTFGKGIGNGFSVAALVGKKEVMDQGGLSHDGKRVFLVSTTHGAENHSLSALRATLAIYQEHDVVGHMAHIGRSLLDGMNAIAMEFGIDKQFKAYGFSWNPYYLWLGEDGEPSTILRTLFLQEMVKNKVLIPYVAPSFSHQDEHVRRTLDAVSKAFEVIKRAIENGPEKFLQGEAVKPVFRKFN